MRSARRPAPFRSAPRGTSRRSGAQANQSLESARVDRHFERAAARDLGELARRQPRGLLSIRDGHPDADEAVAARYEQRLFNRPIPSWPDEDARIAVVRVNGEVAQTALREIFR